MPKNLRYWDGAQWTDQVLTSGLNWRGWIWTAPAAATICAVLVGLAGTAAVIALLVISCSLVLGHATNGFGALLLPAIPLLFAGQVWTILLANARRPSDRRARWRLVRTGWRSSFSTGSRVLFFGELPRRAMWAVGTVALVGWLSAMASFPFLIDGGPAGSSADCAHQLESHGVVTCVSKSAYYRAGAAEQRFAAGIMLGFFSVHAGAALGGLQERRPRDGHPTGAGGDSRRSG